MTNVLVELILSYLLKDHPLPWITPEMIDIDMLNLNGAAVPFLLKHPEHLTPFAWGNFDLTDYYELKYRSDPKGKWSPSGQLLSLNSHPIAQKYLDCSVVARRHVPRTYMYMHYYSSAMQLTTLFHSQDIFCAKASSIAYLQLHPDEISEKGFSGNPAIFDYEPGLRECLIENI